MLLHYEQQVPGFVSQMHGITTPWHVRIDAWRGLVHSDLLRFIMAPKEGVLSGQST